MLLVEMIAQVVHMPAGLGWFTRRPKIRRSVVGTICRTEVAPGLRAIAATAIGATATAVIALALTASAAGQTTSSRTITDPPTGDDRLGYAAADGRVVRTQLGPAGAGRGSRRALQLTFAQFTDSHVLDEESPLRVEYTDKLGPPLTSAYRPQEGLTAQVQEMMVRQIRAARSPVSGKLAEVVMTTGDNTDNTQLNETRWFIDLLDGRRTIEPDSGVRGTCATSATGPRYDGVRGAQEYYDPDASGPAGAASIDGRGYAPDRAENISEAQRSRTLRDFPGLYEAMNRPFAATGLGRPWYGIFGNHDALLEGNQPRNEALEAIATGCIKVKQPAPATLAAIAALAPGSAGRDEALPGLDLALADAEKALVSPATFGGQAVTVPRDDRRRPLTKREYLLEHFQTGGTPAGHGFGPQNVATSMGNYSFAPRPGGRFIVLDTISELGGADGNLDDPQFRWLHDQLVAAEARREVVAVFAHHSQRTMIQRPVPSGFAPGDQGGEATPVVHFGGSEGGICPSTDSTAPPPPAGLDPTANETLRCLLLRHPSVVAYIAGHEHLANITPYERVTGAGQARGGFWEITTPSHIDWPQQSRLFDVYDNRDGTLSIFGTLVDHASAPDAGPGRADTATVARLGAISRELAFNDPQADTGQDGTTDARGEAEDRNVELLVRSPYQ
jgi:metallophosphoesterase (TIGR03767 family)